MVENPNNIIVPVLIIGFNRPDVIKQSFEYIRKARPEKLYVAIDGPRNGVAEDVDLINKVRSVVQNIDWQCEKYYKFNETNQGAELTVSSAIFWVLNNEKYVIVLEDDIIAPLSFLKFAQEMLIKYEHEAQIATVTGSNFTPIPVPDNADYFFAKYGHSWGWATWKRAWDGFDINAEIHKDHLKKSFLGNCCNSSDEVRYYQRLFRAMRKKGIGNNTWDSVGLYRHRINGLLSIIPRVNLTSNIGVVGLHARGITEHHFRPVDVDFIVKQHPQKVVCYTDFDKYHFNTYINKKRPLAKRIKNKLMHFQKKIFKHGEY